MLDIAQYEPQHVEIRKLIDHSLREAEHGNFEVPWNLPFVHWSPTRFAMARRCPEQLRQRYILGNKERPAESTTLGLAVHGTLERNFEQKIETHADIELKDLLEWYLDEGFARIVFEEQEKAREEVLWDTGPETTRQRGKYMIAQYHDTVAPRIQPLRTEGVFRVDFGLAVPVEGRFDLERLESTIDFKTGKQAARKPKEDWRIQAAVYTEATNKPVEFHSLTASPKSNAVTIVTPLESEAMLVAPTTTEREEMRRTLAMISNEICMYMALLGPDQTWPTHGRSHTWACDYCGYRPGCPAWRT